jgi:general nucleoside transport system ATP-binding protein
MTNRNSTDPSAVPPLVAVRDVTKRFPGVVANDRVSLEFRAGEIHVLLGENGAGKSTLIGILAGMQQPDVGDILVAGRPLRIGSPRESLDLGIGTVFQHVLLVPSLSVIENLMLGGDWKRRLGRGARRPPLARRAATGRDHPCPLAWRQGADSGRTHLHADAAGRAGSWPSHAAFA